MVKFADTVVQFFPIFSAMPHVLQYLIIKAFCIIKAMPVITIATITVMSTFNQIIFFNNMGIR